MPESKEIPESKSVYKHRFSDAMWFDYLKKQHILLIGAGGIGSWVAFCLARIGCTLTIYDMDTVEGYNLGGQMYNVSNIGTNKAVAIKETATAYAGGECLIHTRERYAEESLTNPIVISAFDNMAGRKLAFAKWEAYVNKQTDPVKKKSCIFVDGRLLAEEYQVYAVTQDRIDAYKATLFDDGEIADAMCSLKSTTHCSMGIASEIIALLTNFATNVSFGEDIREVPFNISKSIPLFTYNINDVETDKNEQNSEEKYEKIGAATI